MDRSREQLIQNARLQELRRAKEIYNTFKKNSPLKEQSITLKDKRVMRDSSDYFITDAQTIAERVLKYNDKHNVTGPLRRIHGLNPQANNVHKFKTELGGKILGIRVSSIDSDSKIHAVVLPMKNGSKSACGEYAHVMSRNALGDRMSLKQKLDQE